LAGQTTDPVEGFTAEVLELDDDAELEEDELEDELDDELEDDELDGTWIEVVWVVEVVVVVWVALTGL
jgi:hypothetical protein